MVQRAYIWASMFVACVVAAMVMTAVGSGNWWLPIVIYVIAAGFAWCALRWVGKGDAPQDQPRNGVRGAHRRR
jgi:membrane protein implicated in regulation of membrane protease activity